MEGIERRGRERERETERKREWKDKKQRDERVEKGNGQLENINNYEHVAYVVYLLTRDHVTDYVLALQ